MKNYYKIIILISAVCLFLCYSFLQSIISDKNLPNSKNTAELDILCNDQKELCVKIARLIVKKGYKVNLFFNKEDVHNKNDGLKIEKGKIECIKCNNSDNLEDLNKLIQF